MNGSSWRRAVLCLLALFLTYWMVRTARTARHNLGDFGTYYNAAVALRSGRSLYSLDRGPEAIFKSAPCVALALVPLSYLPPVAARICWCVVDLALLSLIFVLSLKLLYPQPSRSGRQWQVGLAAFGLCGRYIIDQLHSGQITSLWVGLAMVGFWGMVRGRARVAGPALATAVCAKVVPLCFVPYCLLRKRALIGLVGVLAATAALLLLPAAYCGWQRNLDLLREWPQYVLLKVHPSMLTRSDNQSVFGLLARLLSDKAPTRMLACLNLQQVTAVFAVLNICTGVGLYGFFWRSQRWGWQHRQHETHLALLLLYMTLFNPLGWKCNFIALIFPYCFVVTSLVEAPRGRRPLLGLLVLAQVLSGIPETVDSFPALNWVQILGGRLWGTLALGVAVVLCYVGANTETRQGQQPASSRGCEPAAAA